VWRRASQAGVCYDTVASYCKANPEFVAEIDRAEVEACDPVEDALRQKALSGNLGAIIFWLMNRSGGRWVDKRHPPVIAQTVVEKEQTPQEIIADLEKMLASAKPD
jgi:hypothetical protein